MRIKKVLIFMIAILFILIPLNASAYTYEYEEDDVKIDYLPGEIDGDLYVRAADARLCLRAAAKLEELTSEQQKAADADCSGEVESSDARAILRASAKIEPITVTVNIKVGQNLVVGPLQGPTGWDWWYSGYDLTKLDAKTISFSPATEAIGAAADVFYSFSAIENGEYYLKFRQTTAWQEEPYRFFDVKMIVS